jgi:hypothetical protein
MATSGGDGSGLSLSGRENGLVSYEVVVTAMLGDG